ncbi:hypothetical protein R1sor_018995 [Riccia sorocarpa]|uniref:DUF7869 domain-containing protein n=1 Tax=Riccia sorocarpa TaxID=122646 RepID=A0ABD3IB98_9MARC
MLESLPIADGIIFLPFSTSCVGEVRVGEQYAGVLVSTIHSEVDPTILDRDLPNFHPDDPITVRWPILHLRIASNGAILGHLYKAFEDAGTRGAQTGDEDMPVKKKRAYNSVKRTKPNPKVPSSRKIQQSLQELACFFQQTAEPLPHKESRNENTDGIIYRLPKALSHDDVYREILGKMEAVGMTAISRVAFDNLWKKEFPNYGMHNSSAFAKCLLCVKFTTMLQRERRSTERAKLELDMEKHLKHQMSGRTVYYSHRELSTSSPSLYLSFIHDAMDLAKTIIPRLCDKVKTLMGSVQPLPLKVIGILNHGHEPGVVAHITIGGLWKSDPNYTITSIAKQLRDYENFHTDKKLEDFHFTNQTSHPLFNALMDEEVFNTTVLAKKRQSKEEFFQMEEAENSELQASTRMLPPNLYIQLDNSAKDNKNWAMMAFCSELVARGCCKMITMSFLVVGHTHEDVDAFFSKMNAVQ